MITWIMLRGFIHTGQKRMIGSSFAIGSAALCNAHTCSNDLIRRNEAGEKRRSLREENDVIIEDDQVS